MMYILTGAVMALWAGAVVHSNYIPRSPVETAFLAFMATASAGLAIACVSQGVVEMLQ